LRITGEPAAKAGRATAGIQPEIALICSYNGYVSNEYVSPALANPTTPLPAACAQNAADTFCSGRAIPAANRRLDAPVPLALWHLASLDAPTVAAVWALAFAWAARVTLPAWTPVLLALVAWPVYIADRLLDVRSAVRNADAQSLRLRHHFHWRYRRIFIPLAVLSACAAAWIIVVCMPVAAREHNSILVAAGLAYFSSVHAGRAFPRFLSRLLRPLLAKETLVAVIFTAACALPALSRAAYESTEHSGSQLWLLAAAVVYFALVAWLNCHSIERWESGRNGSSSNTSKRSGTILAVGLGLAGLLLAGALESNHRIALLVASGAGAALLLALFDRLRGRLTPLALRAAADLVLLTPLPFLFR